MYLSEQLQKKWEGVLDHPDMPAIKDPYRKAVTAVVLENQVQEIQKKSSFIKHLPKLIFEILLMVTIFGVFMGLALFGISGVVIGPVFIAVTVNLALLSLKEYNLRSKRF